MSTRLEPQEPFRFHISLQVSSDSVAPEQITSILHLQPYRTSRKGEPPEGMATVDDETRTVYERRHRWAASFEPLNHTEPLNECLTRIARHFDSHSNALRRLSEEGSLKLYIYAYPGSSPTPVDWNILEQIRTQHPVGLHIDLSSRLETDRPVDENRPKNHS
jgi:hypothetical protein